jgi:hypothetical protein
MFIHHLVSITQVVKDTLFGLDNWYVCVNYIIMYRKNIAEGGARWSSGQCAQRTIAETKHRS